MRTLPEGFKIKVTHMRYAASGILAGTSRELKERGVPIDPKGGWTRAFIYTPNGNIASYALALCSPKDNFCRRIGRTIAVGRALANLPTLDD